MSKDEGRSNDQAQTPGPQPACSPASRVLAKASPPSRTFAGGVRGCGACASAARRPGKRLRRGRTHPAKFVSARTPKPTRGTRVLPGIPRTAASLDRGRTRPPAAAARMCGGDSRFPICRRAGTTPAHVLAPELHAARRRLSFHARGRRAGGGAAGAARAGALAGALGSARGAGERAGGGGVRLQDAGGDGARIRGLWRGVRAFPDRVDRAERDFHLPALGRDGAVCGA